MTILIKGMDMPKTCFMCKLSYLQGERLYCYVTKEEVLRGKIAPDCPLIEVPTPHGRLIDADAFYELLDGGYDLDFDEVPETKRELLRMITDAPTFIEAEDE